MTRLPAKNPREQRVSFFSQGKCTRIWELFSTAFEPY